MFRSSLISFLIVFVVCSFCGRDFKSLGRHAWRCKDKVKTSSKDENTTSDNSDEMENTLRISANTSSPCTPRALFECSCGKICNGRRGLKMHQRSCRIIKDLSGETFERQNTVEFVPNSVVSSTIDDEVLTKVGVNLPKSVDQWKSANDYFKTSLPIHSIALSDLNAAIITMNTTIYDYFEHNFGTVKSAKTLELNTKYKDFSKQSLKSCLKQLKSNCADPAEIKVVSNLLRCKLKKTKPILNEGQVDDKIKKNFWGFVKNLFNKSTSSLPTFEVSTCTNFFSNLFSAIDPFKLFKIPDWIPSLSAPTIPVDLSPPSYHQITKVVRRIKASGSPCPLDQISIIPFKRCPYLRSYLTEIFRIMWQPGEIPDVWKKACTVLVHKKGDQSDPANFRPITLECTPLKIFTSCLRDSMFAFLSANGYIEHHIQKGFMPKLSGTYEHTAQMAHIINRACENLDNIVSSFVRQWLELPVSATFSSLILNKSKYGISLVLPSTKFIECQTTMRNALKSSPNQDIKCLWAETSYGTNLQYDQFKNTKQVLKTIQHDHEERINNTLLSQGLVLSSILKFACNKTNSLWSTVQQSLPRNIFNFSIKYLNNTLPTRKNLCKWSISQSSSCSFCLQSETLQHVVSSCSSYLDEGRYTWRHNSVLLFLANTFSSFKQCTVYADLPSFLSPSLITGESLRPDLLLLTKDKLLYILELTIGFETNIQNNSNRKAAKYSSLLSELSPSYSKVTFINLSMGAIGTMGSSCTSFFSLLNELSFDKTIQKRVIMKAMTISIRSSYFIFCQRNKPWTNPDLLTI